QSRDERPVEAAADGMGAHGRQVCHRSHWIATVEPLSHRRNWLREQRQPCQRGGFVVLGSFRRHDRAPSRSSLRRRVIVEWIEAMAAVSALASGAVSNRFGGWAPREKTAADSGSSASDARTGRFTAAVTSRAL